MILAHGERIQQYGVHKIHFNYLFINVMTQQLSGQLQKQLQHTFMKIEQYINMTPKEGKQCIKINLTKSQI